MVKQKVYLETTMFNYYFDSTREGHPATVELFYAIGSGEYEGYTSSYAVAELQASPEPKRHDMLNLLTQYKITVLDGTDEAVQLAGIYIKNGIIPENKPLDALHIAIASIHDLDFILSFNFKHINKIKTKRMVEVINLNEGYKNIVICQPMEVIDYED
jgi:predicted nucleic acid-binding protein